MKSLSELVAERRHEPPSLSEFPREVGDRLRHQRMAFSLRQSDLAERAGVSVQTIKSVEKGESISYENLFRVLLALGHGVDFLRMLESPHFPSLRAQERYLELKSPRTLHAKRVRATAEGER
jgi:transcriptional regulator with XRE-family HTH domain